MSYEIERIDSHVHLDHIAARHPERIQWLIHHRCAVVSWSWNPKPESVADMQAYLARKRATIHALNGQGLHCGYLAGVHPRNITDDMNPEDAVRLVKPCLDDRLCLGIGEIGLEYDSLHEKEILAAQLSLLPDLMARGKKIGLHTPRENKTDVTLALLALLEGIPEIKPVAVIDHCSAGTLPAVLEAGYHAGITLSPIKTDWRSLPALAEKHADSIDRILCNTDSGTQFYEDLLTASKAGLLESGTAKKLFRDNAARFFYLRSG